MSFARTAGFLVLATIGAPRLGAQSAAHTNDHLRDKILGLFSFGDCGEPLCLNSSVNTLTIHGSHYIPATQASAADLIGFLGNAIGLAVSSVPISAATSGVTFSFQGGVPVATSVSAGPIFGERVQTLGRGRVLIGVNATAIDFKSVRGVPLDDLTFRFTHQNVRDPALGNPLLENDVIEVSTSLNLNMQVFSLFASYGLLNRVDLGVAVPLVRTDLNGGSTANVRPISYPTPHFFGTAANPSLSAASTVDGTATGIGDVLARMKVNLGGSERGAFGFLIDARFPTGREEDFLGSGEFALRGLGIVSGRFGGFSPHLNLGYQYRSGTSLTDAVLATAGFDDLIAPWATLAVDLITQWQVGTSPVQLPGAVVFTQPVLRTVQQTDIPNRRDNLIDGSLGFKFRVGNGAMAVTNVLIPLNNAGIRGSAVGTVGLEYTF
jgi:hypothetical protein